MHARLLWILDTTSLKDAARNTHSAASIETRPQLILSESGCEYRFVRPHQQQWRRLDM